MKNKLSQPNYYAFFDVDGTLTPIRSTHSFLRFYYMKTSKVRFIGRLKYLFYISKIAVLEKMGCRREWLNNLYYKNFRHVSMDKIKSLSVQWFNHVFEENHFFIPQTLKALMQHQQQGAEIVLVSGSFQECLTPLAKKLGIKHLLATKLATSHDKATGYIDGLQMIGEGKVHAIKDFLKQRDFNDFQRCYAYSDHDSDYPMLNLVGHRYVVAGHEKLMTRAKQLGWPIIRC